MSIPFNREAYDVMMQAEVAYLLANAWVRQGDTDYWSSAILGRDSLRQGHAVNCQKQFDRYATQGLAHLWRTRYLPLLPG